MHIKESLSNCTPLQKKPWTASILVPCRALTQHPPPAQGWLYPTTLCYKGLYRDVLLTEEVARCAGMEQLTFLKALKRPKGLMGTTEHLKGARAWRSSWVPATLRAQLAESAGCLSVQPPVLSSSVRRLAAAGEMLAKTHWGHNGNSKKQTRCSASEKCN